MKIFVRAAFLLVAAVNLAPVLGVTSVARLQSLYGIEILGPDIEILLRHRAVLFSVVGLILVIAAFNRSLRSLATAFALLSMLSFVVVAVAVGGYGAEIGRVVVIDVVASVVLLAGVVASRYESQH